MTPLGRSSRRHSRRIRTGLGRDVLERVRARHEVDRLRVKAGRAGVARRKIVDPERLEVGGRGDPPLAQVAHEAGRLPPRGSPCRRMQPLEREVDELGPEVRPDVEVTVWRSTPSLIGELNREIPTLRRTRRTSRRRAPARGVLLVGADVAEGAPELAAQDALPRQKRPRRAPLEHVVHALRARAEVRRFPAGELPSPAIRTASSQHRAECRA